MIALARTARLTTDAQVNRENPWPGLSSYDESSHAFFSGRAAEADELLRRILDEPITVLFGKSGLGKTSLLQAGVFPRLREKDALPILIRLQVRQGSEPLMEQVRLNLFEELRVREVEHADAWSGETLWEYLHRARQELWTKQNRLVRPVFVFDQFEELFTLGRAVPVEIERFREDLADLAENRIPAALARRLADRPASDMGLDVQAMPYKVVITLREDFLADLEGWRLSMPSLRRNRMRLLPMGPDQAKQAVCNDRTNHLVSEPLAREIVRFLSSTATKLDPESSADAVGTIIEPALLSLFCRGVNEQRRRDGKRQLDHTLIESAKGTIVLGFYRTSLADQAERVWTFIEENLITEHGYRNSYSVDDAIARGAVTDKELQTLINRHLLRHDHHLGADRVELTHDLLTAAVADERDARRERDRARRERGQRWKMMAVAATLALVALVFAGLAQRASSARTVAEAKSRELHKTSVSLEKSNQRLTSMNERLAKTSTDLQVAVTNLRDAVNDAEQEKNRANRARDRSRSHELAALAEMATNRDPERAIALALAGLQQADTAEARSALMDAAQYAWPSAKLEQGELGGAPDAVSLSADGSRLAVLAGGNTISLWNVSSRKPSAVWTHKVLLEAASSIAFSPDQRFIAVGRKPSIDVLDVTTGGIHTHVPLEDVRDRRVVFSPDGRWLASNRDDDQLQLLDYHDGWATPGVIVRSGPVGGFAVLSGGKRIVAVGGDPLSAFSLDLQSDGTTWQRNDLPLSSCMSPQSVSPGTEYFSATWRARACTYRANNPNPRALALAAHVMDRATLDIVWNLTGRAFAELLVSRDRQSQDLIVGRVDDASRRLESRIKGGHPNNKASEKSQLISVDDSGTRVALIDADEHQLVRIYSLAHHKPFLSRLPTKAVAMARDGGWIAVAGPAPGDQGAILDVISMQQAFARGELSARTRIAIDALPIEMYATRDSVITVLPTQPVTTALFDAATGKPRFEPVVGAAQPLGNAGDLLLVSPMNGQPWRVVNTRDGSTLAPWDQPQQDPDLLVRTVLVSPDKQAIAVLRAPTPRTSRLSAVIYLVRADRLLLSGYVADLPDTARGSLLPRFQLANDARVIRDARSKQIWPVNSTLAAARRARSIDPGSAAPPNRFDVQDSNSAGVPMLTVVRRADKSVLGSFASAGPHSEFSDDDRWLANWGNGREVQILDLANRTVAFTLHVAEVKEVEFVAHSTLVKLQLADSTMFVPLDRALMERFAKWLAPPTPDEHGVAGRMMSGSDRGSDRRIP